MRLLYFYSYCCKCKDCWPVNGHVQKIQNVTHVIKAFKSQETTDYSCSHHSKVWTFQTYGDLEAV